MKEMLQIFMLSAAVKPYVGLGAHFVSFKRIFEKAENDNGDMGADILKDEYNLFLVNKPHTEQQCGGGAQATAGLTYDLNERVFVGAEIALGYQGIKTNPYMEASFFGNIQGAISVRLPKDFQVRFSAGIEVDRYVSIGIDSIKTTGIYEDDGAASPLGKAVSSMTPGTPAGSILGSPSPRRPARNSFDPSPTPLAPSPARKLVFEEGDEHGHKKQRKADLKDELYVSNTNNLPIYIPSAIIGIAVSKKLTNTWMLKIEGQLTHSFLTSKKGTIESINHNLFFNLSQKRIIVSVVKFL